MSTVAETMAATGADRSVILVPPAGAKAAVKEAINAQIPLAVVITVHDTAEFWAYAAALARVSPRQRSERGDVGAVQLDGRAGLLGVGTADHLGAGPEHPRPVLAAL